MEGGCVLWICGDKPEGPSSYQDEEFLFLTPFFTNKMGFPDSSVAKESACNAGDPGSIPGSGRSSGEGIGYPLQYSWTSFVAQSVSQFSHSVVSDSLQPHGLYSPWNSPGQNTGVGRLCLLQGIFQPRDRTQDSGIVGGFLPAEPQEKPKNTGLGSLSLLQRIFLTQELNQGLLYCRRVLYQLSYQ